MIINGRVIQTNVLFILTKQYFYVIILTTHIRNTYTTFKIMHLRIY